MDSLDKILNLLPSGKEFRVRRMGENIDGEFVYDFKSDKRDYFELYPIAMICRDQGLNMRFNPSENGWIIKIEKGKFVSFG